MSEKPSDLWAVDATPNDVRESPDIRVPMSLSWPQSSRLRFSGRLTTLFLLQISAAIVLPRTDGLPRGRTGAGSRQPARLKGYPTFGDRQHARLTAIFPGRDGVSWPALATTKEDHPMRHLPHRRPDRRPCRLRAGRPGTRGEAGGQGGPPHRLARQPCLPHRLFAGRPPLLRRR